MKLKVKGLVFVGFAAAVFAQSAMAAGENKIVTSQQYVDNKFQTLAKITTTGELDSATGDGLAALWASNEEYPSMAVLKSVKDTLDDINVTSTDTYISVSEGTDTEVGTFTVNLNSNSLASTQDLYDTTATAHNGFLATAGAVRGLIDEETTDDSTTITASSPNNVVPTSKNVYDFVTGVVGDAAYQRKLTSSENQLYVGTYDSTGQNPAGSTWKALESASANAQTATDYVTIKADTNGVYQINLDSTQMAATANLTADTSDNDAKLVTAGNVRGTILKSSSAISSNTTVDTQVPTVKNVYDFVNGNYQAKAATGNDTIEVGHNGGWASLVGDSAYINVAMDTSSPANAKVSLTNVATTGTTINSATADTATDAGDLTTAYAVNQYVQSLLHGNVIPAAGEDCQAGANGITSENGKACALVMSYDTVTSSVGLKWIPMAQ